MPKEDAAHTAAQTNNNPGDNPQATAGAGTEAGTEAGPSPAAPGKATNRLYVVMVHTSRYVFEGQARLARDVGCSRSTISRLVNGRTRPSLELAQRVSEALSRALGRPLPLREIFSPDGTFPTPSGCALCGCPGCMPEEAYDRQGNLKPAFRALRPGDWSCSPSSTGTYQCLSSPSSNDGSPSVSSNDGGSNSDGDDSSRSPAERAPTEPPSAP